MEPANKYDAELVDTIRKLQKEGITPARMSDEKMVDVPVKTIMAVIKDARISGWDAISAEPVDLGADDEDDGIDDENEGSDDAPHDFGEKEARETREGPPEIALKQADTIAEQIALGRAPNKKRRDEPMRGKKPSNTKDNQKLNAARRRRRGGNPADMRRRLLLDQRKKNPDYVYRWVLDRPGRLAEKTKYDDWDVVNDMHVLEGEGGNVTAIAGTNHYNADKMILVRKLKVYHDEDAKMKLKDISTLEDQIRQGPLARKDGQSLVDQVGPEQVLANLQNGADHSASYIPSGEKITIGRSSETP